MKYNGASNIPFCIPYSLAAFIYSDWLFDCPQAYIKILQLVLDKDLPKKVKAGNVDFPGDDLDLQRILEWNAAFFRERDRFISDAKTPRQKSTLQTAGREWLGFNPPSLWCHAAPTPRTPSADSISDSVTSTPGGPHD